MRIAVLAHAMREGGGQAVGTNLSAALSQLAPQHAFLFVVPKDAGYAEACRAHNRCTLREVAPLSPMRRAAFDRFVVPRTVRDFAPDVVLALDSTHAMVRPPAPQAVLVHDAHIAYGRKHFGEITFANSARYAYLKRHFRRASLRCDLVFCQTGVMSSRVREQFHPSGRVLTCGTAVPAAMAAKAKQAPPGLASSSAHLRLLCVTRYAPHKNLEAIVRAFASNRESLGGVVVYLTVAASDHPHAARMLAEISRLGLEDVIINLGHIPHGDLRGVYEACHGLLQPTLLESFSTTYVEAMAFGLPILTSDLDFAHASCGDAALYFDPWHAQGLADAIIQFRDNPAIREVLARKAKARTLAGSTWQAVGSIVLQGLESIARPSSPAV
ncbi:MAG: glycosyltransferase [Thermoplasmatota archaeon]